MTMRGV